MMLMLMLSGCTSSAEIRTDSGCLVFKPIYFSKKDTKATIDQILAHDAVYTELCGDK